MPRSDDILSLPPDLPVPVDGGMAKHLQGLHVASNVMFQPCMKTFGLCFVRTGCCWLRSSSRRKSRRT